MKTILKKIQLPLLFLVIILSNSCIENCPARLIDIGEIPDSVLNLIPYKDAEIVKFIHSNGSEFTFTTERNINEIYLKDDDCECCDSYKFQELNVRLIPDYTFDLFEVNFRITYSDPKNFRDYYYFTIGNDFYYDKYSEYTVIDTFRLSSNEYYNVSALSNNWGNYSDDEIYIDTVYFNNENGIIRISMSNDEYYEIN